MKSICGTVAGVAAVVGVLAATPADAGPYGRWGYYRHGGYWGGAATAGILGGLALGAMAGAASASYYGGCSPVDRPVLDGWGNVIAYRRVEVCR